MNNIEKPNFVETKRGRLEKLAQKPVEKIKKMWEGFSNAIKRLDVKKYVAPLMPVWTGFLNIVEKFGKKKEQVKVNRDKSEKLPEESKKEKDLIRLAEQIEVRRRDSLSDQEIDRLNKEQKPPKEFSHSEIKSAPYERSKPSKKYPRGVTLCSRTAYKNLIALGGFEKRDFFFATDALRRGKTPKGIPKGDAHDVMDYYIKTNVEKYVGTPNKKIIDQLKKCPKNFADLVVKSGGKWEHRAVAFRSNEDGNWYVLDPYARGGAGTKPLPIEKYKANIKIAVPLDAK